MSLTTAIGSKEDAHTVAKILGNAQQFSMLYPNMYVDYSKGHPFLYVNSLIYRRLPDVWTIPDLYELDKDYYDNYKQNVNTCGIVSRKPVHRTNLLKLLHTIMLTSHTYILSKRNTA